MIEAKKSRWFTSWFTRHARRRIGDRFAAVWVHGIDATRDAARQSPLLVVCNHTSWWDSLLVLLLSREIGSDTYALMDARNLRRFRFFRRLGGFGAELDRPGDVARALRYAEGLLDQPGNAVWIFPQGVERPATVRPLGFHGGSAVLSSRARKARVVPLAIRLEFGRDEQPDVFLSFGAPVARQEHRRAEVAAQEQAVSAELDRIERVLASATPPEEQGFQCVLGGRRADVSPDLPSRILSRLLG